MDEDEKLKGQSPHVAYVCSQIGKLPLLFDGNSHSLLSYVILRRLPRSMCSIVSLSCQQGMVLKVFGRVFAIELGKEVDKVINNRSAD